MNQFTQYCSLIFLMIAVACAGVKPAATGGKAGKLYESFYRPDGATQYYIKPLKFSDATHTAAVDFVYRSNFSADSLITCNFSVTYPTTDVQLTSASFRAESTYPLLVLDKIYQERRKQKLYVRYTSKMKYKLFKEVIFASQLRLLLKTEEATQELSATSKTQKRLATIQQQLFFESQQ